MDSTIVVTLVREALLTAIIIQGPILLAVLLVGVLVSLFQAVTQLHEMTLVFIPKILMVALMLYVLGHWMLSYLVSYSHRLFLQVPYIVLG